MKGIGAVLALGGLAAAAGGAPAAAQDSRLPAAGEWAVAIQAGPEFDMGSSFHKGADPGAVTIDARDWNDVYDYMLNVQGDVAVGLDVRSQAGLTLGWTMAEGDALTVGIAGGEPITAEFGDYDAYTARAYYRRYFEVGTGFFPYVTLNAGVRYVKTIDAAFTSAGFAGLGLPERIDAAFYDKSWVPTVGIAFGWRNEFRGVALGLETGVYYDFELKDEDADLDDLGLEMLNDGGDRLYVPVRLIMVF